MEKTEKKTKIKVISWNVNGIRAMLGKNKAGTALVAASAASCGLQSLINDEKPDILCLQETKCPANLEVPLQGLPYKYILESKTKKGYSGVAVFSKVAPLTEIEFPLNEEGRVICLEYPKFYLLNTYTPNSKPDLARLSYRIDTWELAIRDFVRELQEKKPIVFVSDFNVAPTANDIFNAKGKNKTHGFTPEERGAFAKLLQDCDLIDSYRLIYPATKKFSWFSYLRNSRATNKGWRIDMALVSKSISGAIKSAEILDNYYGSDHLPISLDLYL